MMAEDESRGRQLVAVIAQSATDKEKDALAAWALQLLNIRAGRLSTTQKARQAIRLTSHASVIWPTAKILVRELKRLGWDDRSWTARLGFSGAALGAAVFGGQGAGIAALGSAIGVPLWVVLGSGAAFAGALVEEFARTKNP